MNRNRDDFSQSVKDNLAKRAGYCCSNPDCQRPTIGAKMEQGGAINIGIAAHITAASEGGPRYDASISAEERSSIDNGIWLCANCSTLIDRNEGKYTVEVLKEWKKVAEARSHEDIAHFAGGYKTNTAIDIYHLQLLKKELDACLKNLSLFNNSSNVILDSDNFPLTVKWKIILDDNNAVLGVDFTITLHEICENIEKLKLLMTEERDRIARQYPHSSGKRIADLGAIEYGHRLKKITSFLLENLTESTLNTFTQKLELLNNSEKLVNL